MSEFGPVSRCGRVGEWKIDQCTPLICVINSLRTKYDIFVASYRIFVELLCNNSFIHGSQTDVHCTRTHVVHISIM